jgi:hypothetical protein
MRDFAEAFVAAVFIVVIVVIVVWTIRVLIEVLR